MNAWRLGLAAFCAVGVVFLTQPVLEALLLAIRRRIGKRYRWVADIHRYLLVYLSWIMILLFFLLIAASMLDLGRDSDLVTFISYVMAIPIVLGTFALRIVVTNMIVRHFKWDRASHEYDAKIFVVNETMKFLCFFLILVEIFYIFFLGNNFAGFLLLVVFLGIEIMVLLAAFTWLKNIATGLFLVFAEPFRTGSSCQVLNFSGSVEKVSLARTIMRRPDGALIYIPNGLFADFHQKSGSPIGTFQHEISIDLHPATPMQKICQIRNDLVASLTDFSAIVDDEPSASISGYRMSNLSSSHAEPRTSALRTSAFRQSSSSSREQQHPPRALYIGFSDMHRLKVRMTIDHSLFQSLEIAKTEVNLAILKVFENNFVQPLLAR